MNTQNMITLEQAAEFGFDETEAGLVNAITEYKPLIGSEAEAGNLGASFMASQRYAESEKALREIADSKGEYMSKANVAFRLAVVRACKVEMSPMWTTGLDAWCSNGGTETECTFRQWSEREEGITNPHTCDIHKRNWVR